MIELAHKETQGANLLLRYTLGIDVKVGRLTRDFSKSPQAEVVIDVDGRLCPERPGRVYRGRLGLLSRSGIKGCVDTCKRRVPDTPWDDVIDDVCDRALSGCSTISGHGLRLRSSGYNSPNLSGQSIKSGPYFQADSRRSSTARAASASHGSRCTCALL